MYSKPFCDLFLEKRPICFAQTHARFFRAFPFLFRKNALREDPANSQKENERQMRMRKEQVQHFSRGKKI
jgi:hypothetical protein